MQEALLTPLPMKDGNIALHSVFMELVPSSMFGSGRREITNSIR